MPFTPMGVYDRPPPEGSTLKSIRVDDLGVGGVRALRETTILRDYLQHAAGKLIGLL